MIERIIPPGVPTPKSPYSPAVRAGDFIFVSGQGPNDPVTNQMSFGDIRHETRVVLNNVSVRSHDYYYYYQRYYHQSYYSQDVDSEETVS